MNKEKNRGAAGLRRSAIAERNRLREEWSALKQVDESTSVSSTLLKKPVISRRTPHTTGKFNQNNKASNKKQNFQPVHYNKNALAGVVALVDVGSEDRALPLRRVLTALGATVVGEWSPLVTHLIWNDSGTRCVRARARALACKLVSPLWVEACAAAARKLSEKLFPASIRPSDVPSPKTLRIFLRKAEKENLPLGNQLSDSKDDETDKVEMPRLRLQTSSTDTSRDKVTDTSKDSVDVENRVNTVSRRVGTAIMRLTRPTTGTKTRSANDTKTQTKSSAKSYQTSGTKTRPTTGAKTRQKTRPANDEQAPRPPPKSRRKLFTCKEVQDLSHSGDESDNAIKSNDKKLHQNKLTQVEMRDLARAERMAKKLLEACNTQSTNNVNIDANEQDVKPRIVLTGMNRHERQAMTNIISSLGGVVQVNVNKRTTHVLLGSCKTVRSPPCTNHSSDITGIETHCDLSKSTCWTDAVDVRARTLNALWGAATGCRVLHARWAVCSGEEGRWLHHHGFEVEHLRKICQKARVERAALGLQNCDYAFDVFSGMWVRVTEDAEQREAAILLLKLCGAIVLDGKQNGAKSVDVVIGKYVGEVHSKWVFDSVAAARMRTTRRYINMNSLRKAKKKSTG